MPFLGGNTDAGTLDGTEKVPFFDPDAYATAIRIAQGWKGSNIPSASTTDIGGSTSTYIHITGTTTITAFGTANAGAMRWVKFDGALTLTHNATSLILPTGANITTAADDCALFVSEGSGNWRCLGYWRKAGTPLAALGGETISEPVNSLTSSSGTVTVNCALGDYFTFPLTENVSGWSFTNLPAAGKAQTLMIRIQQHASSAKTVSWPASFKWAGGTPLVVSNTLSAYDVLALTTFDQGTRWEVTLSKAHA